MYASGTGTLHLELSSLLFFTYYYRNHPVGHKEISEKHQIFIFVILMGHGSKRPPEIPKHNYSTRNSVNNALSLPYVRTEKYKKYVAYAGANIWNNIPTRIRDSENILIFKRQIKQSIININ